MSYQPEGPRYIKNYLIRYFSSTMVKTSMIYYYMYGISFDILINYDKIYYQLWKKFSYIDLQKNFDLPWSEL